MGFFFSPLQSCTMQCELTPPYCRAGAGLTSLPGESHPGLSLCRRSFDPPVALDGRDVPELSGLWESFAQQSKGDGVA